MLSLEQVEKLIKERINNMEDLNSKSRLFCKYLDLENENDKELNDSEFTQRTRRTYAIMQLEDLIEEIKKENRKEE